MSISGEAFEKPMVAVYDLDTLSGLPEEVPAVKPRPVPKMAVYSTGDVHQKREPI